MNTADARYFPPEHLRNLLGALSGAESPHRERVPELLAVGLLASRLSRIVECRQLDPTHISRPECVPNPERPGISIAGPTLVADRWGRFRYAPAPLLPRILNNLSLQLLSCFYSAPSGLVLLRLIQIATAWSKDLDFELILMQSSQI